LIKNLAGIEVDIADLDVDELAHAHRRIEEQLEQDLVLHVTAVLDGAEEAFQIGIGKQLRQPALFGCPAQAQLLAGLLRDRGHRRFRSKTYAKLHRGTRSADCAVAEIHA
jgi:hypothetical protein